MRTLTILSTLLVSLMLVAAVMARAKSQKTDFTKVLANYVAAPESVFSYTLLSTVPTPVATVYILNVTTLSFLTPAEVGVRSTWFNYVTVSVPSSLDRTKSQATAYFTGGSNTGPVPNPDPIITPYSFATRSIGITVYAIPNQPITFASDPSQTSRIEDAIIAFGWKRFINDTTQVQYVTQMQMVKSSKLCLDAVVQFISKTLSYNIKTFNVIGGSKRGWSSILLAGVDSRVNSLVPAVIPVWNTKDIFERTFNNICSWPPAMADYIAAGVTNDLFTSGFEKLTKIIDPIHYPRLNSITKYQIMSLGDEFFSPDLNTLGYDEIKGDKYVRYIPNTGHSMANSDVFQVLMSYQVARLTGVTMPRFKFSHKFVKEGIIVKVKIQNNRPSRVVLWSATNPNAREFRTYVIGTNVWNSTLLQETKPDEYQVLVRNPPSGGYTALTVELVYDNYVAPLVPGVVMAPLKFTTNAYITPNTIPCKLTKNGGIKNISVHCSKFSVHVQGGSPASNLEFPFAVSIQYQDRASSTPQHICGGSIIAKRYILTAAHCNFEDNGSVTNPSRLTIVYGTNVLSSCPSRVGSHNSCQRVQVKSITNHERYDDRNVVNDIAIYELANDISLPTSHIALIPMNNPPTGTPQFLVGWGLTNDNIGTASNVLMKGLAPIVEDRLCNAMGLDMGQSKGQLCAGSGAGVDACSGDSGGGLAMQVEIPSTTSATPPPTNSSSNSTANTNETPSTKAWVVSGIVSYGPEGCGVSSSFRNRGVYASVAFYRNWIASKVSSNLTFYTGNGVIVNGGSGGGGGGGGTAPNHASSILTFHLFICLILFLFAL